MIPLGFGRRERKRLKGHPVLGLKGQAWNGRVEECEDCRPKSRVVLPLSDDGTARCKHREADRIARKAADA